MGLDEDQGAPGGRRVFLSYARPDRQRVEPLVAALASRGYPVWWDSHIAGGAAFAREIETELRAAEVVIVVWSNAAVESDWVRDEAAVGRDLGRLVPVRLDKVAAPLGFGQYQVVDLSAWQGRPDSAEVDRLVAAIERMAGPAAATASRRGMAETSTGMPGAAAGRRFSRRLLLTGGAGVVSLGGALAWWFSRHRPVAAAPTTPARSIAVLPFANLSGDAAQDYFSDGLTEELISALARLGQLQVVGRTSSFKFKNSREDSHAIGGRLGVAYLLDGSVRRAGDQVRVSAQLVDTKSGFERWSQNYDHDMKDIFAVQTGIAQAVAEALRVQLLGADIAALGRGGASNAAAYDLYLQARRLYDLGGVESNYRDALAKLDAAIEFDPRFAAAHAARARVLVNLGDQFVGPEGLRATYDEALASARRAVQLAPNLADAQATLAETLASAKLDFKAARQAYASAIVSGGGDADILSRVGLFDCDTGEFETGLPALRRATVLDLLNPRVFKYLGYGLFAARRYPEAIAAFRRALALSPGSNGAHFGIGEALQLQGQLDAARNEYALEPVRWLRLTGQAFVLGRLGDAAGAHAALTALMAGDSDVTLYQQGQILGQWGETDRAMAALEAAFKAGDSGLIELKTDPMMDPLRSDPRFGRLLSRLGLGA